MNLLLIGDDITVISRIRQRLEGQCNQVSVSSNWPTGSTMIWPTHYDVIVQSIHIPATGLLPCNLWWTTEPSPLPILVVVSPGTPANTALVLELGADDCVWESADILELNARLYALHRRKVGLITTSSIVRYNDVEINLFTRVIYRGGKRIDLLPREYSLLMFLIENQGRVVSKKEIIRKVWGVTPFIKPNTVEVYVNYLRKKIDCLAPDQLIHTVKGLGYVVRLD